MANKKPPYDSLSLHPPFPSSPPQPSSPLKPQNVVLKWSDHFNNGWLKESTHSIVLRETMLPLYDKLVHKKEVFVNLQGSCSGMQSIDSALPDYEFQLPPPSRQLIYVQSLLSSQAKMARCSSAKPHFTSLLHKRLLLLQRIFHAVSTSYHTRIPKQVDSINKNEGSTSSVVNAFENLKIDSESNDFIRDSGTRALIELGVQTGLAFIFSTLKEGWIRQETTGFPSTVTKSVLETAVSVIRSLPPLSFSNENSLPLVGVSALNQISAFLAQMTLPDSPADVTGRNYCAELLLGIALQRGSLRYLLHWINLALTSSGSDAKNGTCIRLKYFEEIVSYICNESGCSPQDETNDSTFTMPDVPDQSIAKELKNLKEAHPEDYSSYLIQYTLHHINSKSLLESQRPRPSSEHKNTEFEKASGSEAGQTENTSSNQKADDDTKEEMINLHEAAVILMEKITHFSLKYATLCDDSLSCVMNDKGEIFDKDCPDASDEDKLDGDGSTCEDPMPATSENAEISTVLLSNSKTMLPKLGSSPSIPIPKVYSSTKPNTSTSSYIPKFSSMKYDTENMSSLTLSSLPAPIVYVWGSNSAHQLAEDARDKIVTPKETRAFGAMNSVEAGYCCTFLLQEDGSLRACGKGSFGRLGLGDSVSHAIPRQIPFADDVKIVQISSSNLSDGHSLAVTKGGQLYSWGDGESGKLGHGNAVTQKQPRLIQGPLTHKIVLKASAGFKHSACVTTEGELYTWGDGFFGRLGHGDYNSRYYPTPVPGLNQVGDVVCYRNHTLALSCDGRTVWSFGCGEYGKLGHGDCNKVDKPQVIEGLIGLTIKKIAANDHVSFALSDSNEIWAWGSGSCLGLGYSEAMVLKPRPIYTKANLKIVDLVAGDEHVLVLTEDSQVWAWGNNSQGQCGVSHIATPTVPFPIRVPSLKVPVSKIAAGANHSIVWCSDASLKSEVSVYQPFCVDLERNTFSVLKHFLKMYCKFTDTSNYNPMLPFADAESQIKFIRMVVLLLNSHLTLALAAGKSHSLLGAEADLLQDLLYNLIDTPLPFDIEESICFALNCPLLLPQLDERLHILHKLLPKYPETWDSRSKGQKLQLRILVKSLNDQQQVASILGLCDLQTDLKMDCDTQKQSLNGEHALFENLHYPSSSGSDTHDKSTPRKNEYFGESLSEDLMHSLLQNLWRHQEQQLNSASTVTVKEKYRSSRSHKFNITNLAGAQSVNSIHVYSKSNLIENDKVTKKNSDSVKPEDNSEIKDFQDSVEVESKNSTSCVLELGTPDDSYSLDPDCKASEPLGLNESEELLIEDFQFPINDPKMSTLHLLLSSLQKHLLSYCTRHSLPIESSSVLLLLNHCEEVFDVSIKLLNLIGDLIAKYPEKTCLIHDIAFCSLVGKDLGVLIYSLCLVSPFIIEPLLPSLYSLLHTLDATNKAVSVVAHITDQEDLMDEQDTPTPDTVKSVGGVAGQGAGMVGKSWLWLLDIERGLGLVIGKCLQWMLAGGSPSAKTNSQKDGLILNSHHSKPKSNAGSSQQTASLNVIPESIFLCGPNNRSDNKASSDLQSISTLLRHHSLRHAVSGSASAISSILNPTNQNNWDKKYPFVEKMAKEELTSHKTLKEEVVLNTDVMGAGLLSYTVDIELQSSWLEQLISSCQTGGVSSLLHTLEVLISLNTPLMRADTSQATHTDENKSGDSYSDLLTPPSANTMLKATQNSITQTSKFLMSWMVEVAKLEDWDTYEHYMENKDGTDGTIRTLTTLVLATLVSRVGASQDTFQSKYSALMFEIYRCIHEFMRQIVNLIPDQQGNSIISASTKKPAAKPANDISRMYPYLGPSFFASSKTKQKPPPPTSEEIYKKACQQIIGRSLLLMVAVKPTFGREKMLDVSDPDLTTMVKDHCTSVLDFIGEKIMKDASATEERKGVTSVHSILMTLTSQQARAESRLKAIQLLIKLLKRDSKEDKSGEDKSDKEEEKEKTDKEEKEKSKKEEYCGGFLPSVYHELLSGCFGLESFWGKNEKEEGWSWDSSHYLQDIRCCSHGTQKQVKVQMHIIYRHLIRALFQQQSEKELGDRLSLITIFGLSVCYEYTDLKLVVCEDLLEVLAKMSPIYDSCNNSGECQLDGYQGTASRNVSSHHQNSSPNHFLLKASQTLFQIVIILVGNHSKSLGEKILNRVMEILYLQLQKLAELIFTLNNAINQAQLMKEATLCRRTETTDSQEPSDEEEQALLNTRSEGECEGDDSEVEMERRRSYESSSSSLNVVDDSLRGGRRRLMLQLPRLNVSPDIISNDGMMEDEVERSLRVKQLELMLGNLIVFVRNLCVNNIVCDHIGKDSWIKLLLKITSENTETNLPLISSLRTKILALSLLKIALPTALLEKNLKENLVDSLFHQLGLYMWVMPAAQAQLQASKLVLELNKHMERLMSPNNLMYDEPCPNSPEENLASQDVSFDTEKCKCCTVESGHTLVHGSGGRGYGLASTPITSGCYQWKFLIVKENRGYEGTCVGVSKYPVQDYSYSTSDMWLYRGYSGNLYHNGEKSDTTFPGFTQGDYITVILDMEAKTLSFGKNDKEPKLAFENVDSAVLYPCVMFYSTNAGEKVKLVDMHKRCSPKDLDTGEPLCAPSAAVMCETHVDLLRELHESPAWNVEVNNCIAKRLSSAKETLLSIKESSSMVYKPATESVVRPKERGSCSHSDKSDDESGRRSQNDNYDSDNVSTTSSCSTDTRTNSSASPLISTGVDGRQSRRRRKRKIKPFSSSSSYHSDELDLLEKLCLEVWPVLVTIGGVDYGLRIGGQCWVGGKNGGRKGTVLGMLKPGSTSLKVQWSDGNSMISDCSIKNIEPISGTGFNVSRLRGITGDMIRQINRLSILDKEISFPKPLPPTKSSNKRMRREHSSGSSSLSVSPSRMYSPPLVTSHPLSVSSNDLTGTSSPPHIAGRSLLQQRMSLDLRSSVRLSAKKSRGFLQNSMPAVDMLTERLVTNIMDEVTNQSSLVGTVVTSHKRIGPKKSDKKVNDFSTSYSDINWQIHSPSRKKQETSEITEANLVEIQQESISVRLALLQAASIRTVACLLDSPTYAEMLLVPKLSKKSPLPDQEKDNKDKSSEDISAEDKNNLRLALCDLLKNFVSITSSQTEKPVNLATVARCHTILHGLCTRVAAEDSYCITNTQEKVKALAKSVEETPNPSHPSTEENFERPQSLLLENPTLPGVINSRPVTATDGSLPRIPGLLSEEPASVRSRHSEEGSSSRTGVSTPKSAPASSVVQCLPGGDVAAAGFYSSSPTPVEAEGGDQNMSNNPLGRDIKTPQRMSHVAEASSRDCSTSNSSTESTKKSSILPLLLEMGFRVDHINKAITAVGVRHYGRGNAEDTSGRYLNQLVSWMIENPNLSSEQTMPLHTTTTTTPSGGSSPCRERHPSAERRRSNDDALTLFANQIDSSRENVDLSGRRRAFMRRTGFIDIRSFMVPRATGRSTQDVRDRDRPYQLTRGDILRYRQPLSDRCLTLPNAVPSDYDLPQEIEPSILDSQHHPATIGDLPPEGTDPVENCYAEIRELLENTFSRPTAPKNVIPDGRFHSGGRATVLRDSDVGLGGRGYNVCGTGPMLCQICHVKFSNMRHHLCSEHPGCSRPFLNAMCGTIYGRTYILCELCQQYQNDIWRNLRPFYRHNEIEPILSSGGGSSDEVIPHGYAQPPEFLPAPLADMEYYEEEALSFEDMSNGCSLYCGEKIENQLYCTGSLLDVCGIVPPPVYPAPNDQLGNLTVGIDPKSGDSVSNIQKKKKEDETSGLPPIEPERDNDLMEDLGIDVNQLTFSGDRISTLARTTQALRVTVGRHLVVKALSLLARSKATCHLYESLQLLGLDKIHVMVSIMELVAEDQVPLTLLDTSEGSVSDSQMTVNETLSDITVAIGSLARCDRDAADGLLKLCTKHLHSAAAGSGLGQNVESEESQEEGNLTKQRKTTKTTDSEDKSGKLSNFLVTKALVNLLANDSKLFTRQAATQCSPGGTGYSYVSPSLELADSLATCIISTHLQLEDRIWAMENLLECFGSVSNQPDSCAKARWCCDFSGSLPQIRLNTLEAHTSKTGQPLWIPARNVIVTCGFDGTVRTWSVCPRGGPPTQDQVFIFQLSDNEAGTKGRRQYSGLCPAPIDNVLVMPSGKLLLSYVDDIINVWSLTGGEESCCVCLSSPITCIATADNGFFDWCLVGHINGTVTLFGVQDGGAEGEMGYLPVKISLTHAARKDVSVTGISWSDVDGEAAIGYSDGAVRICSVQNPHSVLTVHAHQGSVEILKWCSTGNLLLTSGPRCSNGKVWGLQKTLTNVQDECDTPSFGQTEQIENDEDEKELSTSLSWAPIHTVGESMSPVTSAMWSPVVFREGDILNNMLVLGHRDGYVSVYKLVELAPVKLSESDLHEEELPDPMESFSSEMFSLSSIVKGDQVESYDDHDARAKMRQRRYSDKYKIFNASETSSYHDCRSKEPVLLSCFRSHQSPVTSLTISENGLMLATGSNRSQNGLCNVWSLHNGALLQTVIGGGGGVTGLVWADNHGLVIAQSNTQVVLLLKMSTTDFDNLKIISWCRQLFHMWGLTGMHHTPALKKLLMYLPHLLFQQYNLEKNVLYSGDQLVHSPLMHLLVSLAALLQLDPLICYHMKPSHCSVKHAVSEWFWLEKLFRCISMAKSLLNRPNAMDDVSPTTQTSVDDSRWTLEQDEALVNWWNRSPSDWHIGTNGSQVYMWGGGRHGQLAEAGRYSPVPVLVNSLCNNAAYIACGNNCTFILTNSGQLMACGEGSYGRLGLNLLDDFRVPTLLSYLQEYNIKSIFTSRGMDSYSFAVAETGEVFSWGDGDFGKLGHGTSDRELKPKQLDAFIGIQVVYVACGYKYTAAVTAEGVLYTFGSGEHGALGLGNTEKHKLPQRVTALNSYKIGGATCGMHHTVCWSVDGMTVWSFGAGDYGQLGGGSSSRGGRYLPAKIDSMCGIGMADIAAGTYFTVFLTKDGRVFTCGYERLTGHSEQRSKHLQKPAQVMAIAGHNIVAISVGAEHTLALSDVGDVWGWGNNVDGRLGLGHTSLVREPQLIWSLSGKGIKQIFAGRGHGAAWTTAPNQKTNAGVGYVTIGIPSSIPSQYSVLTQFSTTDLSQRLSFLHQYNDLVLAAFKFIDLNFLHDVKSNKAQTSKGFGSVICAGPLRSLLTQRVNSQSFARCLTRSVAFGRNYGPPITVKRISNRGNQVKPVFVQIAKQILKEEPYDLRVNTRAWKIKLIGEGADDAGGVFDDTMTEMCHELVTGAVPLLVLTPNGKSDSGNNKDRFLLNTSLNQPQHLALFKFLGILLGVAIRTKKPLSLPLAPIVWKLLVRVHPTTSDLEEVDEEYMQSLQGLCNLHLAGVTEESFSDFIPLENFECLSLTGERVPVVAGGRSIPLTFANREEYVAKTINYRLHEMDVQIHAIRQGMSLIVPIPLVSLLTHQHLERLVCGLPDIDVSVLKKVVRYREISENDVLISWLWSILEGFSAEERVLFLRFVSGRSRLPTNVSDLTQRFQVIRVDKPTDGLPTSQTCFFQLRLCPYSSKEIMRERIRYAITNCKTIDMDNYMLTRNQDQQHELSDDDDDDEM